jgi:hypothetical protein
LVILINRHCNVYCALKGILTEKKPAGRSGL